MSEQKIKAAIVGYGNIGKAIEKVMQKTPDMTLSAIFSRRNPNNINTTSNCPVIHLDNINNYTDKIDIMILCGGSATDLPTQTPKIATLFNTVDSFDTHANIPKYLEEVDSAAKQNNKTAVISAGWDPGIFSMIRTITSAILPSGKNYTFWGPGVSQGHSEACRNIKGVKFAVQYTVPEEQALAQARSGNNPTLSTSQKHKRVCYIVPEQNANQESIKNQIISMPNYFSDYNTTVNFISELEFKEKHSKMPHGGSVIHTGQTNENNHLIDFNLKLDSNPEFTAAILIAFARATTKLANNNQSGAFTPLDIPLHYLSPEPRDSLIKNLL